MENGEIKMKVNIDLKKYNTQISKATKAAEKLKSTLDKLKEIEIGLKIVRFKKRWWQFWK